MTKSSEKKKEVLGESYGKASAKLKKSVMLMLVQKCSMDTCYRCGEKILTVDEFSIDHKEDWLNSENPTALFYDLENISFSHLNCNVLSSNRCQPRTSKVGESGEKYIRIRKDKNYTNRFHVRLWKERVYHDLGSYLTLEEAVIVRDNFLQ